MSDTPAANEATTELVLNLMSFTGPERRELQQRFDQPFGDLVEYTFQAIRAGRTDPQAPLVDGRDGARYFPDEVMQFALWVQARRSNPDAPAGGLRRAVAARPAPGPGQGHPGKSARAREVDEIVTRLRLCRTFPGLSWEATGNLTWSEWETMVQLMDMPSETPAPGPAPAAERLLRGAGA